MGDRKSIYKKIKQSVFKHKNPEENNIDPSLLEAEQEVPEEENVPEDFKALFDNATKDDLIRELYFLSMEYKKIKRDNELMNFRLTKIDMENERS